MSPIPYTGTGKKLGSQTIEEFHLSNKEVAKAQGINLHKYDHIKQNIYLAANFQQVKNINISF